MKRIRLEFICETCGRPYSRGWNAKRHVQLVHHGLGDVVSLMEYLIKVSVGQVYPSYNSGQKRQAKVAVEIQDSFTVAFDKIEKLATFNEKLDKIKSLFINHSPWLQPTYFVPLSFAPIQMKVAFVCYRCQHKNFYGLTDFQPLPPHICDPMKEQQYLGLSNAQRNEIKHRLDGDVRRILTNTVNDWIPGGKKLEVFPAGDGFEKLPSWLKRLKLEDMDVSFRGYINRAIEGMYSSEDIWTSINEDEAQNFLQAASATSVLVRKLKGPLKQDDIWYLVRIVPPQCVGSDGKRQHRTS